MDMNANCAAPPARLRLANGSRGLRQGLALAATPAFALMALLSGLDDGPMAAMCATGGMLNLTGMTAMYVLMALFHAGAWLRLAEGRDGGSH